MKPRASGPVLRAIAASAAVVTLASVASVPSGLLAPARANAQSGPPALVIRTVDTRQLPTVTVSVLVRGDPARADEFRVREDGRLVSPLEVVPISDADTDVGVVLAVDTSASMQGARLDQAKAAAREFVARSPAHQRVALVTFSNQPQVAVDFTADKAALGAGIDALVARGERALWDAANLAVDVLGRRPDLQPNVLLLTDGPDTVSRATVSQVRAAAAASAAAVFAVALRGEAATTPLRDLAVTTGGELQAVATGGTAAPLARAVQDTLDRQFVLSYPSARNAAVTIDVAAGTRRASAGAGPGALVPAAQVPAVVGASPVPGGLGGTAGRLVAAALMLVAVALLVYVLGVVATRERSPVVRMLAPYSWDPDTGPVPDQLTLAETTLVRRAVELAAGLARRVKILPRIEAQLEDAHVPLRATEASFFAQAAAGLVGAFTLVETRSFATTVLVVVVCELIPPLILQVLIGRRRRAFQAQLPDLLRMLAGALRSGYSLPQALQSAAVEADEPVGTEVRRAVAQARLGRSVEEALAEMGQRVRNADLEIAVTAIRIQREVGGNLAELLNGVADTMVARERLRREVKALTAEGRISAIVLGILPVAIGALMYLMNPDYTSVLFKDPLGRSLLVGAILLEAGGFAWIRKTVTVKT